MKAKTNHKENVGKKINRLTIIDIVDKRIGKRKYIYYKCKCECGKIVEIRTSAVLRGVTKSCGCYNQELRLKRIKEKDMEIERLNNRIDKAIEYIELVKDFNKEYEKDWEFDIFIPHLLDILKGNDSNE